MAEEELPPWGVMDVDTLDEIRNHFVPRDWKPLDGSPPDPDQWRAFVAALVSEIGTLLWPRYVAGSGAWNTPEIRLLNEKDFELMRALAPHFETPIQSLYPTRVTHAELFSDEDDDDRLGFGIGYERYDPALSREIRDQMRTLFRKGIADKAGTLSLQLKREFQRPRAYQIALIQRSTTFVHRAAVTAATPSLISGHCFQGAMAVCNAFATLREKLTSDSIRLLGHFCVDIGDRRVMAGVHYPSDNLSSWYTALRLMPHVFAASTVVAVQKFLWDAISTKSTTFLLIKRHVEEFKEASPYWKVVRAIEVARGA